MAFHAPTSNKRLITSWRQTVLAVLFEYDLYFFQRPEVVVKPEDLIFGIIPGAHPFAEFSRGFLIWNEGEVNISKEISVGNVLRDGFGEEFIVTNFRYNYNPSESHDSLSKLDNILTNAGR